MPDILPTGTVENPVSVVVTAMPAGGASLTDAELRASPITVSGTVAVSNLPATQPISGTVAVSNHPTSIQVSNFPASQAVTGTFWQATQPVSIAGTVATTQGAPTLTVRNGTRSAAPAANAVLATTGQLAAGAYRVEWNCFAMDTVAVGKGCIVEHRNAADNANIAVLGGCAAAGSASGECARVVVATNERIRITAGSAAGAASSLYGGHVAVYPVT